MMTKKQEEIYNIVTKYIDEKGYSPTVREICKLSGLSSSATVYQHLKLLRDKGYLKNDKNKQRTFMPIKERNFFNVPVIGTVTAGNPIFAHENIEEYFPLPTNYGNPDELFMLKISGDSMINAGINNNDLVIVRKQNYADNNSIVVALINDDATVKRLIIEKNSMYLKPENPAYSPIHSNQIQILGVVIGLVRKF